MREPLSVGRPSNLTLPFTAIGLGGGLLAGDFFRIGCFEFDGDLRAELAVVATCLAAAIGFLVSSCRPRPALARPLVCGVATCASGALAGELICGVYWRGGGPEMGLAARRALMAALGRAALALACAAIAVAIALR